MPGTAHAWFAPKLAALVAEAEKNGIARDVSVAVITDVINSPTFNTAAPETDEGWNQDPGEPNGAVNPTGSMTSDSDSSDAEGLGQLEQIAAPPVHISRGWGGRRS